MFLSRCEILSMVSNVFLVINSSTNIVIYCTKDKKFKRVGNRIFEIYFIGLDCQALCSFMSLCLNDINKTKGLIDMITSYNVFKCSNAVFPKTQNFHFSIIQKYLNCNVSTKWYYLRGLNINCGDAYETLS